VLDSLSATLASLTSGGGQFISQVLVLTNVGIVLSTLLVVPAATLAKDTTSLSGLEIITAPGGLLTVEFNTPTGAGGWEELTIQGHDL
jgi:hypothetical protein